ncbi:MAG TPA: ATP-binding protein [Streptosporangiaceae bacterium]
MTAPPRLAAQPPQPGGGRPRLPRPEPRRRETGGWPLSRLIAVAIGVMALFSLIAIMIGTLALIGLSSARSRVVGKLDPASFQASQLYAALLNQEDGVRGYALSADPSFLAPYHAGQASQQAAVARLRQLLPGLPPAQADLSRAVRLADAWRVGYAQPVVRQVAASGKPVTGASVLRGKADFDQLRKPLNALEGYLAGQRRQAVAGLGSTSNAVDAACVGIAVGLLAIVTVLTIGMRSVALRPLSQLAADARRVADGDFGHRVGSSGPAEVQEVGADVDQMRLRILQELSALQSSNQNLEDRTQDLQRSNAELEQFAYVASHDLQEPLRKVASFCQLLQRRYGGQLDERADQYIEYAVDGAKRMQILINDLLAFSRVGRSELSMTPVSASALLGEAQANLAQAMLESHALVETGGLPVVRGEPVLLTAVFQNLLGNALKFRGDSPPRVQVAAVRDGEFWQFSIADNGIGIDEEYADRVFVIFQRLHDKSAYPGTGIGLAMCRKIIEYHGGRIWLDTAYSEGTRFCFTLPAPPAPPALPASGDTESEKDQADDE